MSNKMQIESIMFDWRLAERGLPSYLHHHEDGKRIDQCEIQFLNKMLEEKNFANMNLNADTDHRHGLKSNLSKKNQFQKVVTIDNLQTSAPGSKCDYCGKQHCDQHPACLQQHKMCEEQRINQLKQQQYQQQQLNQQYLHEINSRPNSQAFCKSTTPDFNSMKQNQINSSNNRSQQYTIQTGNSSFECTGAIRKAGFLSVKKWLLRKRQHVELARKRGWKCYWTVLKGTTLLFYECNFISNLSLDKSGALQVNAANAKLMQQMTSGGRNSSFAVNVDQLRPYSSKSNDTLGDFEENLYENLGVCSNCVHCSRCNRLIGNETNAIYQNRLEANSANTVICVQCSQGQFQAIELAKCLCECHLADKKSHNLVQQIAYQPKHLILIDNSISQPIPEHPHRQFVFCLSTAIGDAYLFQAPCENELNNWINGIHAACAASVSRNKGKQGTLLKLQNEMVTMQQRIDKCNRKKQNITCQIDNILEQQQRQQINISQTLRQQQQQLDNEIQQQQQYLSQLVGMGQITEKQAQQQLISLNKKKVKILEDGQYSDATPDDLLKQASESNKNLIKQFNNQINQIEKQLESHYCESFRLRCYVSSIQYNVQNAKGAITGDSELPNPKTLLSHVTKTTKQILNKLGIFNVSSFHSYTCARSPQILTSVLWNHSQQMQPSAAAQLSSVTQQPLIYLQATGDRPNMPSSMTPGVNIGKHQIAQQLSKIALNNRAKVNLFKALTPDNERLMESRHKPSMFKSGQMKIQLILPPPANTIHQIVVDPHQTIEQLIQSVLKQHHDRQLELIERKQAQLDLLKQKHQQQQLTNEYFACCKYLNNEEYFVPSNKVLLSSLPPTELIQIVPKQLFQVDFERDNCEVLFGFSLEGQCINEQLLNEAFLNQSKREPTENGQTGQPATNLNNTKLVVHVSKVEKGSIAEKEGLRKGDELVLINGTLVSELDMMYVESVLQEELRLSLLLRAVRFEDATQLRNTSSTATSTVDRKLSNFNYDERAQTLNRRKPSLRQRREEKSRYKEVVDELNQYNNQYSDDYIDSLIVQPPPKENDLSEELIDKLIIPKPDNLFDSEQDKSLSGKQTMLSQLNCSDNLADDLMDRMNKTIQELSQHDDLIDELNLKSDHLDEPTGRTSDLKLIDEDLNEELDDLEVQLIKDSNDEIKRNISTSRSCLEMSLLSAQKEDDWRGSRTKKYSLTEAEKVDKVINELIETEITYVKHLDKLVEVYIKPIKKKEILTNLDYVSLFGNMTQVIDSQKEFLSLLTECTAKYLPDCSESSREDLDLDVYKDVLINISKLFLIHTHQPFRQYSTFCSSHFKSQKLLFSNKDAQCANYELIEFVKKRSKGEKAVSLEAYLIKPIQRILKYPLLLQQLKASTQTDSEEYEYLSTALQAMENVALHINEMQRLNEEYGHIIENLQKSHYKSTKQIIGLGPCDLLYYDEVGWSNIGDFIGKLKKGLDIYSMCFVYKEAVIFFCIERNRNKKKNNSHRNDFLETVRYQIMMPINEVQVRAIKTKSDLLGNKSNDVNEENGKEANVFYWELIHLKCSLINTNTQKRSEKVFQLYNSSITFRNVFLRNIRKLIRESVKKLQLPSKTSLSQESVDSIGFSSKEELNDERASLESISKLDLDDLKARQKLGYLNAITLIQHLSERGYEDEDKSQSCSEKLN